jgi:hypothetical protein
MTAPAAVEVVVVPIVIFFPDVDVLVSFAELEELVVVFFVEADVLVIGLREVLEPARVNFRHVPSVQLSLP